MTQYKEEAQRLKLRAIRFAAWMEAWHGTPGGLMRQADFARLIGVQNSRVSKLVAKDRLEVVRPFAVISGDETVYVPAIQALMAPTTLERGHPGVMNEGFRDTSALPEYWRGKDKHGA